MAARGDAELELAIVGGANAMIIGIGAAAAGTATRPVFGLRPFIEIVMNFIELC